MQKIVSAIFFKRYSDNYFIFNLLFVCKKLIFGAL